MIVVVSGLPRSGTSLLMQMLAAGGLTPLTDAFRAPDDSNPRGYYEHEGVKALARDAAWVPDADGHALKVVAPLLPLLPPGPDYRVVFTDRALDEVLRSQASMLTRLGRPAARPEVIRPVFERQLAAAHAWAAAHATASLTLPYPALLADPAAAAARLADFIEAGGAAPLDRPAMAATIDPALYRERA
ncbi:MAG TPA: hypothetical protein VK610_04930 [Rhodothermales bacterium]|nr:hypothetical protein [Rhodothermales bacterium]